MEFISASDGLQFQYVDGGLIIRGSGRYLVEHKLEAVQKIVAALNAHHVKAGLVDFRGTEGPFVFMDRYQIGELAARHLTQVPFAALLLEEQIDKQRIGQLVAANRGSHFELFTDESAALGWLKKMVAAAR